MKILRWTAIILFLGFVFVVSLHSLNSINQDIGRHLKSGEIIWETKSVYKTNLFSFTEPGHPFINHHWLSEVAFYLLHALIGLKGLIILKAGIITTSFFLIFKSLPQSARGWPFLMAGIPAVFVFSSRTEVRPEIFSYLFLSYFLFAILRAKLENKIGWLYALPIVQIFWTNMHIYFIFGPALLFFFLIDRLVHKKERAKFVLKILIASCIATLINPNFIQGALAPLNILRDYGYSIVENQNIFFLTDYGIHLRDIYFFELSLVILILSFIVAFKNHRKKVAFEILAALVFAILAGKMIRNLGLYALVFTSITAINFSSILRTSHVLRTSGVQTLSKDGIDQPTKKARLTQVLLYSGLIFLLVFFIKNTVNNSILGWLGTPKKFGLGIPDGAAGAVRFVQENRIAGPVFNNFDVGSFLIWKLYPEEKVFVDGRPEAYSVEFFEKIYKPMQEDPAVWKRLSEEYKINYIFFTHTDITPWARTFLVHISQNPDWPLIYLDNSTAIFIKRIPNNQKLIERFEINI